MKKTFKLPNIIVLVLLLVVTSCTNNEVEPLFEQTIKERTDALKKEYQDILTAPENGWVGYYSPNNNFGAYIMLMNFDKDGSVSIKSGYKVGDGYNTSTTYRLDKTLKIELVLESHVVFSDMFEINNNDNDGEFVFNILEATQDIVILESKPDFGDDITIFTLKRASADDLNFDPVEINNWFNNIAGDGTQSVFRRILLNDEAIASFRFNPAIRVSTIKYLKDGNIISKNIPLVASATGFYFIKPLDINGTALTNFTFDKATNEYVNKEDNLKIVYNNNPLPGIIKPYNIKKEHNRAGYNFLDAGTSSLAFYNFIAEFLANLPRNFEVTWFTFFELSSKKTPYLNIYTSIGEFWYDLSYKIEDNGRLYFTLTGETNASANLTAALKPLIDLLIGDEQGYYIPKTGTLRDYPNPTFSMINASQPKYEINYYGY